MDATDLRILQILQHSPDISVTDLADLVGLSHTPCWRRMKRLEADGFIVGRAVLLDPRKLGLSINVFAHVRLKNHEEEALEAFERATDGLSEIVECFLMGGDSDYLLRIMVSDLEAYERFLKKMLLHLPGVAKVNSSFALKCIKLTTNLPI